MINLLGGVLGPVVSGVKDYMLAQQDMKKAEVENKARLLRDANSNNHEWEMASLRDKDKWLRRASFAIFMTPMIWAAFDPAAVQLYFQVALNAMPEWYLEIVFTMCSAIWGISALKNSVPALVGGVVKALRK